MPARVAEVARLRVERSNPKSGDFGYTCRGDRQGMARIERAGYDG
jgi:hypothetical protein